LSEPVPLGLGSGTPGLETFLRWSLGGGVVVWIVLTIAVEATGTIPFPSSIWALLGLGSDIGPPSTRAVIAADMVAIGLLSRAVAVGSLATLIALRLAAVARDLRSTQPS
jgi:hypothetical protein